MPILPDSSTNGNASSNKHSHLSSSSSGSYNSSSNLSQKLSSLPTKPQSLPHSSSYHDHSNIQSSSRPPSHPRPNTSGNVSNSTSSHSLNTFNGRTNSSKNTRDEDLSEAETVILDDAPQKKLKRLKRRMSRNLDDPDDWQAVKEPPTKKKMESKQLPPPPQSQQSAYSNKRKSPEPSTSNNKPQPLTKVRRSTSPGYSSREHLLKKHARSGRDANGRLKLQRMCDKGKYEEAKELIQVGADVNDRDYAGNTSIHEAALKGHTHIVQLLLDNGGIIDIRSGPHDLDTPLIDAASNDHIDVVKLLLARGADPRIYNAQGKTPMDLIQDDKPNHEEIERLLREATIKMNKKTKQDSKTPDSDDNDTPDFMDPANYVPGTFPPKDLYSTKHSKAQSNIILEGPRRRGARAQSIRNDLLWMDLTTRTGREQVYRKAADGDYEFVGNFLENGWKPDADCLALAARHGHGDVVNLLLAFGADANGVTEDGDTPLQQTVGRGHYNLVKMLLDAGANPTVVDTRGKSLYDIAKESLSSDEKELALLAQSIQSWKQTKKNNTSTPKVSVSPPPLSPNIHTVSSTTSDKYNKADRTDRTDRDAKSRHSSIVSNDLERKIKKRKVNSSESPNGVSEFKPKQKISDENTSRKPSKTSSSMFKDKPSDDGEKPNNSSLVPEKTIKTEKSKQLSDRTVSSSKSDRSIPSQIIKKEPSSETTLSKKLEKDARRKDSSKSAISSPTSTTPEDKDRLKDKPKKLERPNKDKSDRERLDKKSDKVSISEKKERVSNKRDGNEKPERKETQEKDKAKLEKLPSGLTTEKIKSEKVHKPEKSEPIAEKSKVERSQSPAQSTSNSHPASKKATPEVGDRKPNNRKDDHERASSITDSELASANAKELDRIALQRQRDQSRREREARMLQQIEEDERRMQEKKLREEEAARLERQRLEEEAAKKRAEEAEREQERVRLMQIKADAEMRRNLPYGLRIANYGKQRSIDEVCKFLPMLMRASRSASSDKGGYVVDTQVSLILGIQNLYQAYPELSKKLVTDKEKARLWSLLSTHLCKPAQDFNKPEPDLVELSTVSFGFPIQKGSSLADTPSIPSTTNLSSTPFGMTTSVSGGTTNGSFKQSPVLSISLSTTTDTSPDDILKSYNEDKRKFMSMNVFWLRCDQVVDILRRDHLLIYELYKALGPVVIDLDYDDVKERKESEKLVKQKESEEKDRAKLVEKCLPIKLRIKMKSQEARNLWG